MSDSLDVREFISGYLAESGELLSTANTQLLALDASLRKREHNPRAVRELFRALHTLKGLSAMVGAEPIVELTHQMETLLRAADRAAGRLPDTALDLLVKGVRAVEERVTALGRGEPVPKPPRALLDALADVPVDSSGELPAVELDLEPQVLEKLSSAEQHQLLQGLAKHKRIVRVEFVPSAERAAAGVSITSVRARVQALGDLVKVLPRASSPGPGGAGQVSFELFLVTGAQDSEILEAASAEPQSLKPVATRALPSAPAEEDDGARRDFVRVEVGRLDDALERLSALVVGRARMQRTLNELLAGKGDLRTLAGLVAENGRQLRDLRSAIMRARMVRVSELLERAPLVVRGLARASNKQVRVTIEAGDAELEKTVADRLFPAVMHLLRNAVDHAIEPPGARTAAGKNAEGLIRVVCVERAGKLLELQVIDDGRGIDAEAVARKAQEPLPQDDAALLELITRPGLSTREDTSAVSGRGYGMDIVRRVAVDELGGELLLATKRGEGTQLTIRVPLSITIVDALSFTCSGSTFVVPLSSVDDLAELQAKDVVEPPQSKTAADGARLFKHRGATVPLVALDGLLGLPKATGERPKIIMVRHRAELVGVLVDQMLGQQEVLVRPITDPLVAVKGVAGSTDLGDGRPTLVLDLPGLLNRRSAAA
jgi:two-component system chemotaxis sensor kinase CheA